MRVPGSVEAERPQGAPAVDGAADGDWRNGVRAAWA